MIKIGDLINFTQIVMSTIAHNRKRPTDSGLGDDPGFALYSASLTMTKTYKQLLDPLDLTYPQYLAMLVLWEGDDILVKDIAARLSLDPATVTPLLKRLESLGYINRVRGTSDERLVFVRLTKTGLGLKRLAAKIPPAVLQATGMPNEFFLGLTQNLRSLRSTLQNHRDS